VFGLERLVDATIAKKIPAIAYGTSIINRFTNVIGGENFIDMPQLARYRSTGALNCVVVQPVN
jgi:hypothetical protein